MHKKNPLAAEIVTASGWWSGTISHSVQACVKRRLFICTQPPLRALLYAACHTMLNDHSSRTECTGELRSRSTHYFRKDCRSIPYCFPFSLPQIHPRFSAHGFVPVRRAGVFPDSGIIICRCAEKVPCGAAKRDHSRSSRSMFRKSRAAVTLSVGISAFAPHFSHATVR